MDLRENDKSILIIGAGPAGLAAAHELVNRGQRPIVVEMRDRPGGIARTEVFKGYRFDIGGHRFFTKNTGIMHLWKDILGDDLILVRRISRIFYDGRFLDYPLGFSNALSRMGLVESILILLSYVKAQLLPSRTEDTFEEWVSNRFGWRLYEKFFEPYTAKVWGMPCHTIPADWARQRIKGLSLMAAISNALLGNQPARSLIHEFHYPREGPGMMWDRLGERIEQKGGQILFNTRVIGLKQDNNRITGVRCLQGEAAFDIPVAHLISSLPLKELVSMLSPLGKAPVLAAARTLSYRALILVVLLVGKEAVFPDQWIYVHSPGFRVGRIQNYKNWSPDMVPDPGITSLGMEYFCSEGDRLWSISDAEFADIGVQELCRLGLAVRNEVEDSMVLRQPGAYPIYHQGYEDDLRTIRGFLKGFANLQTIGRNGMHRYNNMDHSMQTGILAAKNVLGANYDIWSVNEEEDYHEEARSALTSQAIVQSFSGIDRVAFGIASGAVAGLLFFVATLWLVLKGGGVVGPHLQLLSQYFWGYSVTPTGAWIALGYGFLWGFLLGWLFAYLRNRFLLIYLRRAKKKAERDALTELVNSG